MSLPLRWSNPGKLLGSSHLTDSVMEHSGVVGDEHTVAGLYIVVRESDNQCKCLFMNRKMVV